MNVSEVSIDKFAKEMTSWNQEDDKVLDKYRLWQLDILLPYLGKSIVEIGAGNGRFARVALQKKKFERYLALEPSDHFFQGLDYTKQKENLDQLEIYKSTVNDLANREINQKKFDSVFSIHVLEHVEDDLNFIKNSFCLLKPGGHLITLVPALPFMYSPFDKKIGHFRRYNKSMMKELAKQVGAEIIVNRYDNLIGLLGWFWVFKVKKMDYHSKDNKISTKNYFAFFSNYILPFVSRIEKIFPPPVGLNLTCVLRKPLD